VVPPADLVARCRDFGLEAVYVFGSRAAEVADALLHGGRLSPDAGSDVDIGVLPRDDISLGPQDLARLTMSLESLLGDARVDLVILPDAPPFLALDIVSGERLAAGDKDRVAEYELYVLRRAGDLAPFERERRRLILAGEAR
jgi:predicted nucleotidyltransferase